MTDQEFKTKAVDLAEALQALTPNNIAFVVTFAATITQNGETFPLFVTASNADEETKKHIIRCTKT